MKKSTILFAIIAFLFMGNSGIAQKSAQTKIKNLFKQTNHHSPESIEQALTLKHFSSPKILVSKPGNSEGYYWETGTNDWFHSSNTLYTYTETGLLLEQLITEAMLGTNLGKNSYAYDLHGNMTEEIFYQWIGSAWDIIYGSKYMYTYDNNGNITEEISQYWDYLTNSWVNSWKEMTVYDNNGNVVEQSDQYWENGEWVNDWKDVLTINTSGVPIELTEYVWEGNEWVPDEKYTDIVWHNWEDLENSVPESYIGHYYNNGTWVNYERYNAIYTGENYVGTYEMWENNAWVNSERDTYTETATEQILVYQYWENGQWVNSGRDTETFDDHGNSTGTKYEYWYNGAWIVNYANAQNHTYNNDDDITETIIMNWDELTLSLVNSAKYMYSNFYHFESGIYGRNSTIDVHIYPNPVSSAMNIKINEVGINQYQVDILNVTGQTIYTSSYSSLSASINVENLNRGIYILRITTDNNKTYNYKLMKD